MSKLFTVLALLIAATASGEGLAPGAKAPDFTLQGSDGNTYALSQFVGRRGVVLAWFPKAFTPGCTGESCDFRDNHDRFFKAGYEVIGVSPDPTGAQTRGGGTLRQNASLA